MGFEYIHGREESNQREFEKLVKKPLADESQETPQVKQVDEITFVDGHTSGCIGLIDIVNSTKITAKLDHIKARKFYSIFLNRMSDIVREFGGKVVKNIGDSILYYFPETFDVFDYSAFKKVLDCSITMIKYHDSLNQKLQIESLPTTDYRISADYGYLMMAESLSSTIPDVFSQTVNICSKMNKIATPNTIVIGGDLHQIVKQFTEYDFDLVAAYSSGLKLDYPIYTLLRSKHKRSLSQ